MLQQHAHYTWATTIIKLIILSFMVRAGYVCVAIIHRTLTWSRGSLACAQMLMHAIWGCTDTESLHWKLTLGRKSLAATGNRTCVSGMTVRCSNQLSYIPSTPRHNLQNWLIITVYSPSVHGRGAGMCGSDATNCIREVRKGTTRRFGSQSILRVCHPGQCLP